MSEKMPQYPGHAARRYLTGELYQTQRAAYWESRCRVAMEALEYVRGGRGNSPRTKCMEALAAIGELPPVAAGEG